MAGVRQFLGGIKLIPLDPATGKPARRDSPLYALASRPRTPEIMGSIEGAFILRHDGFYYLFASFDFCCRGVASTYNIRVGRAAAITGPYIDRAGTAMLEGGGTLLLSGSTRWRGPGHNTVYRENNTDWLVYHAYDAEDNGIPRLRIEELTWDDGWPQASSASASLVP